MRRIVSSFIFAACARTAAAMGSPMSMSLHLRSELSHGAHALGELQKTQGWRKTEEQPSATEISQILRNANWVVSESSSAGSYKSTGNQDSHFATLYLSGTDDALRINFGAFAVADGHYTQGHITSHAALSMLSRGLESVFTVSANFTGYVQKESKRENMTESAMAMQMLERAVTQLTSAVESSVQTTGSTLSVAVADFVHDNLVVASAGDSPVLRVDEQNETLILLSPSHNMESREEFAKQVKRISAWFQGKKPTITADANGSTVFVSWNNYDQFNTTDNDGIMAFLKNLAQMQKMRGGEDGMPPGEDDDSFSNGSEAETAASSSDGSPANSTDATTPKSPAAPAPPAPSSFLQKAAADEQQFESGTTAPGEKPSSEEDVNGTTAPAEDTMPTLSAEEEEAQRVLYELGLPTIDGRPVSANSRRAQAKLEMLLAPMWRQQQTSGGPKVCEQLQWSFRLGALQMSRAIGDSQRSMMFGWTSEMSSDAFVTGQPEVKTYELQKNEKLLVLSDGVDNVLASVEATRLYNELLACQGQDNCPADPVALLAQYAQQGEAYWEPFWAAWEDLHKRTMEATWKRLYQLLMEARKKASAPSGIADYIRQKVLDIDATLPSPVADDITVVYLERPGTEVVTNVRTVRSHTG